MDRRIEEMLEDFASADDVDALRSSLAKHTDHFGFSHFAYMAIRLHAGLDRRYSITNYPDDWHFHYSEREYIDIDPVVRAAYEGITPLNWGADEDVRATSADARKVFNEASEFGLRRGITVPIHGCGTEFGTFTVASDRKHDEMRRLWQNRRHDIHIMGMHFHEAVSRMLTRESARCPVRLSPRETDCLSWTARGKTAWEIGQILSISEETVVFHLKNANKKLGVYSKHHAVVRAIMSGIIIP